MAKKKTANAAGPQSIQQVRALMKKLEKHISRTLELGVQVSARISPARARQMHKKLETVAKRADRVAAHVRKLR